jgi:predicted transcriptional regulator
MGDIKMYLVLDLQLRPNATFKNKCALPMHMRLEAIRAWNELDALDREELLSCVFRLTDTEAKTYFALAEKARNVQELAAHISKDRTTSQKILKKLVDEGLAHRVRKVRPTGGMKYVYEGVDFSEVKSRMVGAAESWLKAFSHRVDRL